MGTDPTKILQDDGKADPEDPSNSNTQEKEFLSNVPYGSVTEALAMFKDDDLVAKPGTKFRLASMANGPLALMKAVFDCITYLHSSSRGDYVHAPRNRHDYSTHGFTLASAVLEKASGKEFKKLVEDLTFQLGMRHTTLDANKPVIPNRTNYYVRNSKHVLENCSEVDNSYKWAGGGILSDVTDLLIFSNAILYSYQASSTAKDAFLRKDVIGLLWKGETSVNSRTLAGLGWMRVNGDNFGGCHHRSSLGGLWYHTGSAVGASSVLLIRPNTYGSTPSDAPSGVCVAMLCNLQDTSLLNLAKEIEEIFRE